MQRGICFFVCNCQLKSSDLMFINIKILKIASQNCELKKLIFIIKRKTNFDNWDYPKRWKEIEVASSSDPLLLGLEIEIKCNLVFASIKMAVENWEFNQNWELKKLEKLILIIKTIEERAKKFEVTVNASMICSFVCNCQSRSSVILCLQVWKQLLKIGSSVETAS